MKISFNCDHCGSPFTVDAQLAGRAARCRKCNHRMVIPGRSQASRPLREPYAAVGVASRGTQVAPSGAMSDPRRGGSSLDGQAQGSRRAAAVPAIGWLDAVNSQIGLKPISMASLPTIPQRREEREEKSVTSYKVIVPRELRRQNSMAKRAGGAVQRGYMEGVRSYRQFFNKFAKLFRWINETAYGISILFLLLAIVGAIMNKHSLTVLGISAIVLLNVVRLGAGLFNLVVIPFRDNPVKGLLFLFPPVTAYYLWQNWYKWRKPVRRIVSPIATLAIVIAAYVYIPWLNGNKQAQARLQDRISGAVETIKQDVSGSLSDVSKKAGELKEELPGQIEKLHLDEVKDKAQHALEGIQGEIQKFDSSNPPAGADSPSDTTESAPKSTP